MRKKLNSSTWGTYRDQKKRRRKKKTKAGSAHASVIIPVWNFCPFFGMGETKHFPQFNNGQVQSRANFSLQITCGMTYKNKGSGGYMRKQNP
jgi:hypothetical protein